MNLFGLSLTLFLLMDSIGNVPIFLSILKRIKPERQRAIIFRELILALIIIISFFFIGNYILALLKISQEAVNISGGVILFVIGLKLVFPKQNDSIAAEGSQEPFLVPLAVPLVAGPATLATVMLLSHKQVSSWLVLGAIFIAWVATTVILLAAPSLKKVLGERGIAACERFTGLILIMLSIQMFLDGLKPFFGAFA
ncbi:MAG: NAAT family transporter [Verrucomicrobia bacterium]|nr:NAAT family transporter [Verrucomicrobiota bacterium]